MSNSDPTTCKHDPDQSETSSADCTKLQLTSTPIEEHETTSSNEGPSSTPIEEHKTTSSLGGLSATDEDEIDGFVTPTSTDQRIPEIRPCPPPPRKLTSETRRRIRREKRKSTSPDDIFSRRHRGTRLLLDLSNEIDSMFPPILRANLSCKIKKARSV